MGIKGCDEHAKCDCNIKIDCNIQMYISKDEMGLKECDENVFKSMIAVAGAADHTCVAFQHGLQQCARPTSSM